MSDLIIQTGKHHGKKLKLPDAEVVIGRDETCRIRLASDDVSRRHCLLTPTADGLTVRDLGSRNGTYVNETLIETETRLEPGDQLRIGPMTFQISGRKSDRARAAPFARPGQLSDSASDADIAAWLSDEEESFNPGETTIVSNKPQPTAPSPPTTQTPVGNLEKRDFESVAAEAADIIRRHWESVGQDNSSER